MLISNVYLNVRLCHLNVPIIKLPKQTEAKDAGERKNELSSSSLQTLSPLRVDERSGTTIANFKVKSFPIASNASKHVLLHVSIQIKSSANWITN